MTTTRSRRRPDDDDEAVAWLEYDEELSYWHDAKRPLTILIFLLPLVLAYEIGMAAVLRSASGGVITNLAHKSLLRGFELLGMAPTGGFFLGGLVIIVVLFLWHILARDEWRVRRATLGLMAIETLVWTIPLLAIGALLGSEAVAIVASSGVSGAGGTLADLPWVSRLTISVGAGLYEELVFRMLLIAIVHTVLVDLAGLSSRLGASIAILLSAVLFAAYHPLGDPVTGALSGRRLAFFFLAGLFFAGVYVLRGFGIVVAVHALYDVVTVSMMDAD